MRNYGRVQQEHEQINEAGGLVVYFVSMNRPKFHRPIMPSVFEVDFCTSLRHGELRKPCQKPDSSRPHGKGKEFPSLKKMSWALLPEMSPCALPRQPQSAKLKP
jgi:hypothetical protein